MDRSVGEEAYAQAFQFFDFVPLEKQEELKDYLYKYSHNLSEAYEYFQIAKQGHEMENSLSTPLLFRIHGMALQSFALAVRRMTDDSSERSLQNLVIIVARDEFQQEEIVKIRGVHQHYKTFLNKFVAHQDRLSVGGAISAFPDVDIIEKDLAYLQQLYDKIVVEICKTYIGISNKPEDYSIELKKLVG